MKKLFLILTLLISFVAANAQRPVDSADLRIKINQWVVTNGNKAITATQINNLFNGVADLMTQYSFDSAYRINDTLFLVGPKLSTFKITMKAGTVTAVSGTANRITSSGGANPSIDISATFEALLGKVANRIDQNNASTTSAQLASVISDETGTGPLVFSASPTFTGTPLVPTATPGTNTTQIASTAFVTAAVAAGAYTLPAATTGTRGGVRPDGTTITISGDVISSVGGGGGTPAGSNTQIQFNNSGVFGSSANMKYKSSDAYAVIQSGLVIGQDSLSPVNQRRMDYPPGGGGELNNVLTIVNTQDSTFEGIRAIGITDNAGGNFLHALKGRRGIDAQHIGGALAGDELWGVGISGFLSDTNRASYSAGGYHFYAIDNFTMAHNGTYAEFFVTRTGQDANTGRAFPLRLWADSVVMDGSPIYAEKTTNNNNAYTGLIVKNNSTGTSAVASLLVANDNSGVTLQMYSSTNGSAGLAAGAKLRTGTFATGGLELATGTTAPILFQINDNTVAQFDANSQFLINHTMTDGKRMMQITATEPSSPASFNYVSDYQITTVSSGGQAFFGLNVDMLAGATDAALYSNSRFVNAVAGTGNTLLASSGITGNTGLFTLITGTTTGNNAGAWLRASGGNLNIGAFGSAIGTKNSATNIGVLGQALNAGTTPIVVGVAAMNNNSAPTSSATFYGDNGSTSFPLLNLKVNNVAKIFVDANGLLYTNTTTNNNAFLQIGANTTTNASIFFNGASADVTSPTDGMLWYNSTAHALDFRDNSTTYKLARSLTGSGTLDFPSTGAGVISTLTITVTGAAVGDPVLLGTPAAAVTTTATYWAYVSSSNTVTVVFSPKATEDPSSATFKATVIPQ